MLLPISGPPIYLFFTSGYTTEELKRFKGFVSSKPNHFVPLMAKNLNDFQIFSQYPPLSEWE